MDVDAFQQGCIMGHVHCIVIKTFVSAGISPFPHVRLGQKSSSRQESFRIPWIRTFGQVGKGAPSRPEEHAASSGSTNPRSGKR